MKNISDSSFKIDYTIVPNKFIQNYMTNTENSTYVLVYLYGLMIATSGTESTDPADAIASNLKIDKKVVYDAYNYWAAENLVRIISFDPLNITYLDINTQENLYARSYPTSKYNDFNKAISQMYTKKELLPNDYIRFYDVMEQYIIEPDAMILIAKHCIKEKENRVSIPYILTVAINWANQGIRTHEEVDSKIFSLEQTTKDLKELFKVLGLDRPIYTEDRQYYLDWTTKYGFSLNTILYVAKLYGKKGGMDKLNENLLNLRSQSLLSIESIKEYEEQKTLYNDTAIKINKILGIFTNPDFIIEKYINTWVSKGFSIDSIMQIAELAFDRQIKDYTLLNEMVNIFYKNGVTTPEQVKEKIVELNQADKNIRTILRKGGASDRYITHIYREYYNTWVNDWNVPFDTIIIAANHLQSQRSVMKKINSLLLQFKNNNALNPKNAEQYLKNRSETHETKKSKSDKRTFTGREYTEDELKKTAGGTSKKFQEEIDRILESESKKKK